MANYIKNNEERAQITQRVMQSYGVNRSDAAGREAAEVIAARSMEAREYARKQNDRRYY